RTERHSGIRFALMAETGSGAEIALKCNDLNRCLVECVFPRRAGFIAASRCNCCHRDVEGGERGARNAVDDSALGSAGSGGLVALGAGPDQDGAAARLWRGLAAMAVARRR